MIFDTDVLIWYLRGSVEAAAAIDDASDRAISLVTLMELLQGANSKREAHQIKGFLKELCFETLPLSERIGYRASIYVEEYALSHGTGVADALVAATAVLEARTGIEPMSTDLQKLAHYITNCISYKKYRCAIECAIQIGDFSKDSYIRSMEVWLLARAEQHKMVSGFYLPLQ
jgi:predicted nucleic acid-binding protein